MLPRTPRRVGSRQDLDAHGHQEERALLAPRHHSPGLATPHDPLTLTQMLGRTLRLASVAFAAVVSWASASAQDFQVTQIASGLGTMTGLTSPPGDPSRLIVARQSGLVSVIRDGVLLPSPFLDLSSLTTGQGERGLLGIAFHPDYRSNRKFYVSYTNTSGASVVRQYLRDAADPDRIDAASFTTVLGPLAQPFSNHNGGCIAFGPDGMLYLGLGDGGAGAPSQDPGQLLGKLVRLDLGRPFPHVPADNPFLGDPGTHDLIWASGLRNPWRFSFDRLTGDLWIGDVGAGDREEVDFQPSSSAGGENYGWPCMEGTLCTGSPGCTCHAAALTLPVHEYPTGNGNCSVIGGYVYRGSGMPSLFGHYVFSDWCSGQILTFLPGPSGHPVGPVVDRTASFAIPGFTMITSFGEDARGELYALDSSGGEIWRLEEVCAGLVASYCQSAPNSLGSGALIASGGTTSLAANDFVLRATGAAPGQFGVFYYGAGQTQAPFGDGWICVGAGGAGLYRFTPLAPSDGAGAVQHPVDFGEDPAASGPGRIESGSTWNFQYWYRDPAGPGGAGFNLSDGLSATFCP